MQKTVLKNAQPVINQIFASNAKAAGILSFFPDTEVEAASDKLLSRVTDAVILLTSSSSELQKEQNDKTIVYR